MMAELDCEGDSNFLKRLVDVEVLDDEPRIHDDVRSEGMECPHVNPCISRAQGQIRLHEPGREKDQEHEHGGYETVRRRIVVRPRSKTYRTG